MLNLTEEIIKLKKEKNAIILAHNYQKAEVQDIADFVGDSLELSRISRDVKESVIVFAGVRFMAETAKILSSEKTVILPVSDATCAMAEMVEMEEVIKMKREHPNAKLVAYVNTTAEIKSIVDVCCTSSNAVNVVNGISGDEVIFLPDRNLADFVRANSKKKILAYPGWCYVHDMITAADIKNARKEFPESIVFIHPESRREVQIESDFVLSTGMMMKKAASLKGEDIIVGTEEGMVYRLKKEYPQNRYHVLKSKNPLICSNMKMTDVEDIHNALLKMSEKIEIDENIRVKAKRAIDEMLKY